MQNYGFIVENNDGDEFPFTISTNEKDLLFREKIDLCINWECQIEVQYRTEANF